MPRDNKVLCLEKNPFNATLFYLVGKPFRYLSFDGLFPRTKDQLTAKNKAIGQLKKYIHRLGNHISHKHVCGLQRGQLMSF